MNKIIREKYFEFIGVNLKSIFISILPMKI